MTIRLGSTSWVQRSPAPREEEPYGSRDERRTTRIQGHHLAKARCSETTRRRYGSGAPPKPPGSAGSCNRSAQCEDPGLDRLPPARVISRYVPSHGLPPLPEVEAVGAASTSKEEPRLGRQEVLALGRRSKLGLQRATSG